MTPDCPNTLELVVDCLNCGVAAVSVVVAAWAFWIYRRAVALLDEARRLRADNDCNDGEDTP